MMRVLCAASVATLLASAPVAAQVSASLSAEQLRTRSLAFINASITGEKADAPAHAKSAQYIIEQLDLLRTATLRPAGDRGKWSQPVPLVSVRVDSAKARLTGFKRPRADHIAYAFDFLPMLGALGYPSALDSRIEAAKIVTGGTLGPKAIDPALVRDKIVVFSPPVRPDGQPDYQLWAHADLLARYKTAAAILVESLELMPRSVIARINDPWLELPMQPRSEAPLPPVIAVSRAAAVVLEDEHSPDVPGKVSFALSTRRDASTVAAQNIVATLTGRDAAVSREIVVLSARYDADGTGAMAVLAIAEALARSPVPPRRSVVFLWTIGGARGEAGSSWFMQHPPIALNEIVGHIDAGMIGEGQTAVMNIGCRGDALRLGGRESMEVLFGPTTYGGLFQQVDYARYATATQSLAALVTEMANGARRPVADGCAR